METRTLPETKRAIGIKTLMLLIAGLFLAPSSILAQDECKLTCIGQVNVSLDAQCERVITIFDVLKGMPDSCEMDAIVELEYPFKDHYEIQYPALDMVDGTLRGYRLTYQVKDTTNGNRCWGYLTVEDKYPPQIMCEDDTVSCFEESLITIPTVDDNCEYPTKVDVVRRKWEDFDCDSALASGFVGIVTRTLIAYDVWGNSLDCDQTIWIRRLDIDEIIIEDFDSIECSYIDRDLKEILKAKKMSDKYGNYVREIIQDGRKYLIPIPACVGSTANLSGTSTLDKYSLVAPPAIVDAEGDTSYIWPTDLPTTKDKNFSLCMVYTHFKDHIIPTCGDVYKIRREWKVSDWCAGEDTTLIQYIKIIDTEGPELDGKFHTEVTNVKPHECLGHVELHWPGIEYDCWSDFSKLRAYYSIEVPDKSHPGRTIFYSGYLDYEDDDDGLVIYLPEGEHEIYWEISDLCGNYVDTVEVIDVKDVTAPTPFCDEISQVTLDPDHCWARVYARDLDDGSHDNCCEQLHFAVAKMSEIDHYWEKWEKEFRVNCGDKFYWSHKEKIDSLIRVWINCFVFDEYVDVGECGEETLVVRVYEACGLKNYDPHVFHGTRHDWFCYQTWDYFAAYYTWNLEEYKQYKDPKPDLFCENHYGEITYGIDWGLPCVKKEEGVYSPKASSASHMEFEDILSCVVSRLDIEVVHNQIAAKLADERWEFDYRYNDCMVQLIKDDKVAPICKVAPDVTVFCDGVPYHVYGRYCNVYDSIRYTPYSAYEACYGPTDFDVYGKIGLEVLNNGHHEKSTEHPKHCLVADPYEPDCKFCVTKDVAYETALAGLYNLDCQNGYYGGPDYHHYGGYDQYYQYDPCGYDIYDGQIFNGTGYLFNWRPIYCREWLELDRFDECDYEAPDPKRYFSPLEFSDNCDNIMDVDSMDEEWINECGEGWIQRIWTVTDCQGNIAKCSQRIYVKCRSDFEVLFQEDLTVECTFIDDLLPSKEADAITKFPEIHDDECELIGISYEDEVFEISTEACYKILRTWTIIDWCKYNPTQHMRYPDVIIDDRLIAGEERPCIYRNVKDDGDGLIKYTQVIKVIDVLAPELVCAEDTTINYFGPYCHAVDVLLPVGTATDECTPQEDIKFSYRINIDGLGETFIEGTGRIIDKKVPVGEHVVEVTATDKCGNEATCTFNLTIVDKKAPTPFCFSGIATVLMPTSGMVRVWASDLVEKVEDNCSNPWPLDPDAIKLSFTPNVDSNYIDYDCSFIGSQTLRIYVTDEAGNQDFCETFILIQDNQNVCPDISGANISGSVHTETDDEVEHVQVSLRTPSSSIFPSYMTGVDGYYNFANVPMNQDYKLTAHRNDVPLNGVSTFDLVLMQKHILGITEISSPYKLIAADINRSNTITALDVVELRKLILGVYDELPNNYSWLFIPRNYSFFNPTQPWNYHEAIEVRNLNHAMAQANFVGIKVGDINDSNVPHSFMDAEIRNVEGVLKFTLHDRNIAAGEIIELPFTAENFENILGYQFTLDLAGMEILEVKSGALDISESNFGLHTMKSGYTTVSWNHATALSAESDEVLFTLILRTDKELQLSRNVRIHSSKLRAEAYNGKSALLDLALAFNVSSDEMILYQNTPNPFDNYTIIGFNLPSAADITLNIFDVAGKVIHSVEGHYTKGYNELKVLKKDLSDSGILYYQLEVNGQKTTKKMVVIN